MHLKVSAIVTAIKCVKDYLTIAAMLVGSSEQLTILQSIYTVYTNHVLKYEVHI